MSIPFRSSNGGKGLRVKMGKGERAKLARAGYSQNVAMGKRGKKWKCGKLAIEMAKGAKTVGKWG